MSMTVEMEWTPTQQAILGPDPELMLYAEVSLWFHKLDIFRKGEDDRMYRHQPNSEDLEIHKKLLLRLIADGEHLAHLIQQSGGLIRNKEEIKLEDLKAAVETLQDTLRGWHEPMPTESRDLILKEVFPDVT